MICMRVCVCVCGFADRGRHGRWRMCRVPPSCRRKCVETGSAASRSWGDGATEEIACPCTCRARRTNAVLPARNSGRSAYGVVRMQRAERGGETHGRGHTSGGGRRAWAAGPRPYLDKHRRERRKHIFAARLESWVGPRTGKHTWGQHGKGRECNVTCSLRSSMLREQSRHCIG
ncbi:hypothetical protein CC85DRAFT_184174 [Cutaneotrichosporon oleaginosum]|uniref:Uncharacterized protein n=1 Tax=Cutaneotrichosporon oleaginosum TaxID=879819 RepID=A0A0J0XEZ5_9TREE|nr:uncharacterized protein CC85DRAFT_184174 [Cutaneotrichosporon oleaginosum]KLT39623.1 hypothetical protein CC85DRAFT_184174 [Cutaneotrichosporon oleaginosum]TXT05643.1 hypothetical protein COLE_06963 [Cutaneotrichosporon oleaginosum]